MLIFIWKISQGMVGGYHVEFNHSPRRGRLVNPNRALSSGPATVRRAREASLASKGAKIFNLLPAYIRNINSENVETFKKELDSFLSLVPDQPTIPGHPRAAETNSLLHQIPILRTTYTVTN